MICLTSSFYTAPRGVVCSIWTHGRAPTHTRSARSCTGLAFRDMLYMFYLLLSHQCLLYLNHLSLMFLHFLVLLYFRPPDRRRRDVFGVANNTLFNEGSGNTTLGPGDNSTDGIPPIKEYPFSEDKSTTEYFEILNLRPFTVYRIDIHACNEEVRRCSAGTFVYSRTKPAGDLH